MMVNLEEMRGWELLYSKHKHGKRLEKREVLDLLADEEPLTTNGFLLMQAMINNEVNFCRQTKKYKSPLIRMMISLEVVLREIELKKEGKPLRGESHRDRAKAEVAARYLSNIREVESCLKEHEAQIDKAIK